MNVNYEDILSKLGPPMWWDENAVPRYTDFHPNCCNIYAREVVFMEIACQACDHRFNVAMSLTILNYAYKQNWEGDNFPPHYGDPPNIDCCSAGSTMNSEHIRVISRWKLENSLDWVKVKTNEINSASLQNT